MSCRPLGNCTLRKALPIFVALFVYPADRAGAATTLAPPPACSAMVQQIKNGGSNEDLRTLSKSMTCFYELALKEQRLRDTLRSLAAVQKSASTVQTGSPSGSNGTTSAVSKPITPLSLATEYGGITTSTSNQTMTLQTTLDGVPSALAKQGIRPYCVSAIVTIPGCVYWKNLEWLNRFGVGVTANTTSSSQNIKGTASPPEGTAQQASLGSATNTAPSLSSIFVKVTLWRGAYKLPAKGPEGTAVRNAQFDLAYGLADIPPKPDLSNPPKLMSFAVWNNYQEWQTTCIEPIFTFEKLKSASDSEIDELFFRYYARIVGILFHDKSGTCSPTSRPDLVTSDDFVAPSLEDATPRQKMLINAFETYIAAASLFEAQLSQMLLAASAPVLSVEYDFNTPVNQPTTSTVKLVGSKAFGPKICAGKQDKKNTPSQDSVAVNRFTGTINVGGNFYNSTPSSVPGASAFRDLQAGTEMDLAFCTSAISIIGSFLGNSTLGLTYYYQDQVSPSILKVTPGMPLSGISIVGLDSSTSSVFTKKGPINFVQLKYGLGTGKNVKFPIAVSWSNRTDLITHSLWSAQFGVSYDFSSLLNSSGSTSTSGQ